MFDTTATGKVSGGRRIVVRAGLYFILLATLAVCQSTSPFPHLPGATTAGMIEGEPPMQKVLASDIGKRVQIVGRLGHSLGELITI